MRKKSFAEIVAEVEAEPSIPRGTPVTWGGPFLDLAGHELTLVATIRPAIARQLVLGGALLAWDVCGCENYPPDWVEPEVALAAAKKGSPRFARGNACDTYLDHWRDECGDVVCLHGDVNWGIDYPQ